MRFHRVLEHRVDGDRSQSYEYDAFGNLIAITTQEGPSSETRSIGVVPTTNRLSVASYDAAGRMTSWGGRSYEWDGSGRLASVSYSDRRRTYAYTAEGERIWAQVWDGFAAEETLALRGLGGELLREWRIDGAPLPENISWLRDHVHGLGAVAVETPSETLSFHRDHLGSTRLLTRADGTRYASYDFFALGELVDPGGEDEPLLFTGHERDANGPGTADDQDYLHARYYSPHLGRFTRPDPRRGVPGVPQSLNRYAYVRGRALTHVDPDGRLVAEGVALVGSGASALLGIAGEIAEATGHHEAALWLKGASYTTLSATGAATMVAAGATADPLGLGIGLVLHTAGNAGVALTLIEAKQDPECDCPPDEDPAEPEPEADPPPDDPTPPEGGPSPPDHDPADDPIIGDGFPSTGDTAPTRFCFLLGGEIEICGFIF